MKDILERIFEIFDKGKIPSVVHFGNTEGKDIDIFIILDKNIYYDFLKKDDLDITVAGLSYFRQMLTHFDPVVTEPLLTGEIIYGDSLENARKHLASLSSNTHTVNYLRYYASLLTIEARKLLESGKLRYAMINAVFSMSYFTFSEYYSKGRNAIKFKELLEKHSSKDLQDAFSALKRESPELENSEVATFINKAEEFLKI